MDPKLNLVCLPDVTTEKVDPGLILTLGLGGVFVGY